jgi:hypothetical protein
MVLPPGEVFDHRGMLSTVGFDLCCDFDIPVYIYDDRETDMICCCLFCACANLAPREREVELYRALV